MVKQISIDIEVDGELSAERLNAQHEIIAGILTAHGYTVLGSSQEDITEQYQQYQS